MKPPYILPAWALIYLSTASAHISITIRDAPSIVTITVAAPTSPPSESYTTDSTLIDSALNSTNVFRQQHNAPPLTWNTSLADAAASWASKCQWKHSDGPTGENLALGYPDMTSAIDAWGNERNLYDFGASIGFSKETGHFTQLVWKETSSMGCAAVDCSGKNKLKGHIVVCEYWPPGNMVGEDNKYFRANVQAQVEVKVPPIEIETPPVEVELPPVEIEASETKVEETPQPSTSPSPIPTTEQAPPPPPPSSPSPPPTTTSLSTRIQTITKTATATATATVVTIVSRASPQTTTTTRTATVVTILPSTVAAAPQTKSTAWALGEEARADKVQAGSKGRWALGVTVAAVVIAAAMG